MNDTTFQVNGKIAYVPVVVNTKMTKQTNADRIRAMSDEELGRFINSIITVNFDPFTRIEGKLILDVEEWLQKEVEE